MSDSTCRSVWSHVNPVRITVGPGGVQQLPGLTETGRILLVTTPGFTRRGLTASVLELLGVNRVVVHDAVTPNPELDVMDDATAAYHDAGFSGIVALGGGSVLDAAKTLAATLPSGLPRPLHQALREGVAHHWDRRLPVVAIPTTSGTGAEVTPFATVWDKDSHKKYSLTGEFMFPTHALLDPDLTLSLPPEETLYTALDAISHALESLWNKNRTPLSTAYAIQSLALAVDSLPTVLATPKSRGARAAMQQASMLAGLAISQTRTAIAHSMSYPLTTHFGVPHGLACSFTLPALLAENLERLAVNQHQRRLLEEVYSLLRELKLTDNLKRYASPTEVMSLQSEMRVQGRAENFLFDTSVDDILTRILRS